MKAKVEVKEIVIGLANGKELRLPLEEAAQLREALNNLMSAPRPAVPHWTPYSPQWTFCNSQSADATPNTAYGFSLTETTK